MSPADYTLAAALIVALDQRTARAGIRPVIGMARMERLVLADSAWPWAQGITRPQHDELVHRPHPAVARQHHDLAGSPGYVVGHRLDLPRRAAQPNPDHRHGRSA